MRWRELGFYGRTGTAFSGFLCDGLNHQNHENAKSADYPTDSASLT